MTDWREISTQDYIIFLSDWKTRQEIAEHFELSNVSSWHACKFLAHLNEIQCVKGHGFTKRCMKYKSRQFALEKALHDQAVKKLSVAGTV